jgi:hypothetical protein
METEKEILRCYNFLIKSFNGFSANLYKTIEIILSETKTKIWFCEIEFKIPKIKLTCMR